MSDKIERITLASSVVEPIMFRATRSSDVLVVKINLGEGETDTIEIPLNGEGESSLDPLLGSIADGEFLALEIVKYV